MANKFGAQVFPANQVIVVGGGLGGFSAAHTILEHGGRCLLLDKSPFCGGNSTKATSGINGANTITQRQKGVADTNEIFIKDIIKGGALKPELAKVLAIESGPGVDWLIEKFNLDLSLLARLGGHSQPRTHRGSERFPGMTITYALMERFEKISEESDRARIINNAHVFNLITEGGKVIGCEYFRNNKVYREYGPVIMASGGFGADFGDDSLLAKYRPDLLHLPTTNGIHCTGDGIKMGEAIGAKTIDMDSVQVHPTGLVNVKSPEDKVLFLAAEALRGVGGILLDANGKRFANELGRRDYVTGEMWKNQGPFRLCLNEAASQEIIWHCKHYTGRGVMKFYESGAALAAEMGVSTQTIADEMEAHAVAADKQASDPEGGKFPAYPDGKTHDEASGKTGSGKKFFHNVIRGSQFATQKYYVAIVTPVIHYCMGGLEITVDGEVLGAGDKAIPGFYAAGEIAGGIHGKNRLGGNSLLDCVVFGRVSGRACARYTFGEQGKYKLFELEAGDKKYATYK
jgi:flavocytochrome c